LSAAESSPQILIADMVRRWVMSGPRASKLMSDRAADLAVGAYEDGASVSEACELARRYVQSWRRHPANGAPLSLELAQSI